MPSVIFCQVSPMPMNLREIYLVTEHATCDNFTHSRFSEHLSFAELMALTSATVRCVRNSLRRHPDLLDIPTFLCPALLRPASGTLLSRELRFQRTNRSTLSKAQTRAVHIEPAARSETDTAHGNDVSTATPATRLPPQCTGCGALSQTVYKDEPGFYSVGRKAVKLYLNGDQASKRKEEEDLVQAALQGVDAKLAESLGNITSSTPSE
jgi:hypothetical protein